MKVYEMTIADIASEIFDKGEDFAEKIFNDIDELEKNKLLEIDQLKQQLAEKDGEINSLIADYEKRISQEQELMSNMEHRLTEKQNEIDKINKEFVQAVHDWKALCAKKDEEIERLKNLFKLNNEVVINQGNEIFDLRVQVLQQKQNQTQLAVAELEKVKEKINKLPITDILDTDYGGFKKIYQTDAMRIIDQQIKELKGESK